MARIRSIKPEYWTSPQVARCSVPARLLFAGMWTFSDDNGIYPASCYQLKLQIFPGDPFTEEQIRSWINELLGVKLLREYEAQGELYWIATGFKKHQRIRKPAYKYPLPESDLKIVPNHSTTALGNIDKHSESDRLLLDEASTDVTKVFQHWQKVMGHPKARLDKARRQKIEKSLKEGYTVPELEQAIDGCSLTPYNMGENPQRQRYDGLDLILRDAEHIERFISHAKSPPVNAKNDKSLQPDWMEYAE